MILQRNRLSSARDSVTIPSQARSDLRHAEPFRAVPWICNLNAAPQSTAKLDLSAGLHITGAPVN